MPHVTAENVRTCHKQIATIDEQIDFLQEAKKRVYGDIRRDFDQRTVEGMKVCMKFAAMDGRKLEERLQFDALGLTFLNMIDGQDGTLVNTDTGKHVEAKDDGWMADRERERAEPFDPETGEVIDQDTAIDDLDLDDKIVAFTGRNAAQDRTISTC